jgi:hypothetical protein
MAVTVTVSALVGWSRFRAVEREANDGQGFPLLTGLLGPVVAASCRVNAVADLGHDTFDVNLAGMLEHCPDGKVDFFNLADNV